MAHLPDDVLLVVFSHTDIDTFLDLRLLNHHTHELINHHIHGLCRSVARATFPGQTRILLGTPATDNTDKGQSLRWLKDLRHQQLAAILVEHDPKYSISAEEPNPKHSISAEDPIGDEMRRALAGGWRLLAQTARIARELAETSPEQLPTFGSTQSMRNTDLETVRLRELELGRRYLDLLSTARLTDLVGYKYVQNLLLSRVFGFSDDRDSDWEVRQPHWPDTKNRGCWVSSYVLKLGPQPFWQALWVSRSLSKREKDGLKAAVEVAWEQRDENTRMIERRMISLVGHQISQVTCQLWSAAKRMAGNDTRLRKRLNSYFTSSEPWESNLLEQAWDREDEGITPPPPILGRVPISHTLDQNFVGQTPILADWSHQEWRRRRRCCGEEFHATRTDDATRLEYDRLYREWQQGKRSNNLDEHTWKKQLEPFDMFLPGTNITSGELVHPRLCATTSKA